jgi:predicted transcriptional regulator
VTNPTQPKHRRRRLLAHPATLALAGAGSSVIELADALDVSPSAAGMYLSGHRQAPERLPNVLRSLLGAREADNVLALIPTRDERAA